MKSIESIDKSFEDRFDPKLHTIRESQFLNYDKGKKEIPTSKIFRVQFSESIPEETKLFLRGKLHYILDFPGKFGLKIHRANHLLRFIDQETYESEMGTPLPKNIPLPASRLKFISKS